MSDTDEDIAKALSLPTDTTFNMDNETDIEDEWFEEEYDEDIEEETSTHYNSEDYISGSKRSKNGTIPMNILEFHHSFGYNCQKFFNLCVIDCDTLIFISGNLIHFFNVKENKLSFRRSSTGNGIGHITKNPAFNHIAVGENGKNPPIIIYEWPNLEIVKILKKGTTRSYSHLAYNPSGLLLVSQGGEPDYLITIWNWQKSNIISRYKSHGQDIYNVTFSPSVKGHLTTCGSGHIKFWKIAKTFTGLKLKGELGRFGKTEISDIIGIYPMPDGKVVSSCEWGNILLWVEGQIKLQVCKKNKKPCHAKMISQFEFSNGELISVGMDGWIYVWYYETIDQADPSDDHRFIEIEPIYEFLISEGKNDNLSENSMLMCIQKRNLNDPEESLWYAQDGNGGLWLIDLSTFQKSQLPKKLLSCHAGPITDMDVAEWGPFVATCGKDGRLHIYNYLEKRLIMAHKFHDASTKIIWFPCQIEATGSTLVCAYESGIIRVITVAILEANKMHNMHGDHVRLLQVLKSHTMPITWMTLNTSNSLLVTGSEDATIFVFHVEVTKKYPNLIPIGYIKIPSAVTCITWKPQSEATVLIGCSKGYCAEVELPINPQTYTTVSYELTKCEAKIFRFKSVKSSTNREIIQKKKEIKKDKFSNSQTDINEEDFSMNVEGNSITLEMNIPEVPNQVLIANYSTQGTIWLTMSGFDAGYIYEYSVPEFGNEIEQKPLKSTPIPDADDTEIKSCLFYNNRKYLFLGMQHGEIRICKLNPNNETDLSNYWILPMHDNFNGCISTMKISYDYKMLLSCGHDGNLFSFFINDDEPLPTIKIPKVESSIPLPLQNVEDIEEPDHPSLEEVLVNTEQNRIINLANQKKNETLAILEGLAEEYRKILERNRSLPESQQIPEEEFELDERITADLNNQLNAEMNLVCKKLAYKDEKSKLRLQKLIDFFIEPITCLPFAVCKILTPNAKIQSLRERKLGNDFSKVYTEVTEKLKEKNETEELQKQQNRTSEQHANLHGITDIKSIEEIMDQEEKNVQENVEEIESFLKSISSTVNENELNTEIKQMLKKYRIYKTNLEERQKDWKVLYAGKPNPKANHPDDIAAIEEAKNTIGDYYLKISPNCNKRKDCDTVLSKYKQILDCRKKVHSLREDFNDKLKAVRSKKLELQKEVEKLIEKLKMIHTEIPVEKIKSLPAPLIIDKNIEFPEHNLELKEYKPMFEKVKDTKQKKKSVFDEMKEPIDEEYVMLLMDENLIRMEQNTNLISLSSKINKAQTTISAEKLEALRTNDRIETPMEREMKRARVMRKIYEQDCILKHIQKSYEDLDNQLDELDEERLNVVADCVYIDLLSLTFNQELIIFKDFQTIEKSMQEKIDKTLQELFLAKQKIQAIQAKIERRNKEIKKFQENIKDLQIKFMGMIKENKFHNFLKKIFKKKYRPPKINEGSSSESSTDSSTDDDFANTDDENFELVHLNENICPEKCDRELYDAAFSMREKRYEYELQIKEEQKEIDLLRKENDSDLQKMKKIEIQLEKEQNNFEAVLHEKQQKLNNVDITVVLKFHQLQHILDSNSAVPIEDCLVFDKSKLSQLYARVGQLEQEAVEQKEKHKKYKIHLQRIKIDCDFMEGEIKKLKEVIKEEMIKKFGEKISLNDLYESVLLKMIYNIKSDMGSTAKIYDKQIKCIKKIYKEKVDILQGLIKENTKQLNSCKILEEEERKLQKTLRREPMSEHIPEEAEHYLQEEMLKIEQQYCSDLTKLENIFKNQLQRKVDLCREIQILSSKSKITHFVSPKDEHFKKLKLCKESVTRTQNIIYKNTEENYISEMEKIRKDIKIENKFEENDSYEDNQRISRNVNDDNVDFKFMVGHLFSQIIETIVEDTAVEEETQKMIKDKLLNLPITSLDELQKTVEENVKSIIATLKQDDNENTKLIKSLQESLNILYRLDNESEDFSVKHVHLKIKEKLRELLQSIGIKNNLEETENSLLQKMKEENNVNTATAYLMERLPADTEEDTVVALYDHVIASLTDIFAQYPVNNYLETK